MLSGDQARIATTARSIVEASSKIDTTFRFELYDKMWVRQADLTGWIIDASGTDPRNITPTAKLTIKGDCPFWQALSECRNTMVGLVVETAGQRYAFYVKTFTEKYENGAWTGIVELNGIWDILNYLVIWPTWFLPLQAQPISHAVFIWALCTCLEAMVSECALRIQSGLWEFINNALSLNPDIRTWFGTLLQTIQNNGGSFGSITTALKHPVYVQRTNPFLDTSPLVARTVRMETCGAVIGDITKAYGVDTRMDLWLPGDPQPDDWAHLTQPTYVFSTKDRSQITGPFGNVLDSVLRTIVDIQGSLFGNVFDPFLNPKGQNPALPDGAFEAEQLGINFVAPYAVIVAPENGEDSAIISCEISHHTPEGWQHIVGGRSAGAPWLNRCGAPAQGLTLTQRSDECDDGLADRQHLDHHRVHRHTVGPTGRVPEQLVPRVPDDPALRATQRGRPVPPRHRDVHRHHLGPVQHRNDLRVHQQALGYPGLQRGGGADQRGGPERAVRTRPRHLQGRPHVAGVPRPHEDPHRLHRKRHLAHHPDDAGTDRPTRRRQTRRGTAGQASAIRDRNFRKHQHADASASKLNACAAGTPEPDLGRTCGMSGDPDC
jgi:hypothetical protein